VFLVTGVSRFVDNSRAVIAGTTDGTVKLLIDGDSRKLLGIHIVGVRNRTGASGSSHPAFRGGTIDYFMHATFDVPTMSDAYEYAAFDCLQRMEARTDLQGTRQS
jgi:NAD(P) transhydrogenase